MTACIVLKYNCLNFVSITNTLHFLNARKARWYFLRGIFPLDMTALLSLFLLQILLRVKFSLVGINVCCFRGSGSFSALRSLLAFLQFSHWLLPSLCPQDTLFGRWQNSTCSSLLSTICRPEFLRLARS